MASLEHPTACADAKERLIASEKSDASRAVGLAASLLAGNMAIA